MTQGVVLILSVIFVRQRRTLECGDPAPLSPPATRRGRNKSKNPFLSPMSFSLRSNNLMGVRQVERLKAAPGRRTPKLVAKSNRQKTKKTTLCSPISVLGTKTTNPI